jgi:hypothetical protein
LKDIEKLNKASFSDMLIQFNRNNIQIGKKKKVWMIFFWGGGVGEGQRGDLNFLNERMMRILLADQMWEYI